MMGLKPEAVSNDLTSTWPEPQDTPLESLCHTMAHKGYAVLNPSAAALWAGCQLSELHALLPFWDHMPLDAHLKDGGSYRRRRHSCFEFHHDKLTQTQHRAHWQSWTTTPCTAACIDCLNP